jgi:hypothetical protein
MKKNISFIFFLTFFTTLINAQQTNIAVQKGQKYRAESTLKTNSSAEVMGQSMETTADNTSITVYEITAVSENELNLQVTITKLQASTSAMGQEMSYDSDKKDNSGPLADILGAKINKPEIIVLDEKGHITKRDENNENQQGQMMGMNNFNATSIDLFVPALIGKELKAGESFTDISTSKKEKYSSRDSGTYTITAIENGIASVSYSGTQEIVATIEQMGMEMISNSNNIVKAEMQVEVKTGLVVAKATVIESNVSVDISGMTIPTTGKTITTLKITPVQ